jgi:hypothetical protein
MSFRLFGVEKSHEPLSDGHIAGRALRCRGRAGWFQFGANQLVISTARTLDTSAVGKVMTADGTARIEHAANVVVQANLPAGGVDQAKAGDLVYRGDLISTGADGKLSISFADGTAFNVSSNARMEVNEFVYDPKGHANSSLMSLSKGTFTFIAGNVAHTGDMKVDTPLGTMGIRGTAPRVEILEDGTVKFSTLVEEK